MWNTDPSARTNEATRKFVEDTPTIHQLLDIALKDLRGIEADPNMEVDMDTWVGEAGRTCYACLAGASMVTRLRAIEDEIDSPSQYVTYAEGRGVYNRLLVLNRLRMGELEIAWEQFYGEDVEYPFHQHEYVVEEYYVDRSKFFHDMHRLKRRIRVKEEKRQQP